MKLSDLEQRYKDRIVHSDKMHQLEADEQKAKAKLWEKVSNELSKPKRHIKSWLVAAASITLLFMAWFAYAEMKQQHETIAKLENQLQELQNSKLAVDQEYSSILNEYELLKNQPPQIDTVFQTKIVYKEIIKENPDPITENIIRQEPMYMERTNQSLKVGETVLDLANVQDGIENLKIEYGQKTKNGITPWTFTVKYQ